MASRQYFDTTGDHPMERLVDHHGWSKRFKDQIQRRAVKSQFSKVPVTSLDRRSVVVFRVHDSNSNVTEMEGRLTKHLLCKSIC